MGRRRRRPGKRGGQGAATLIFSHPAFATGLEDILFLLLHCLLKTSNECVVEGVGSIVNQHADPRRASVSPEVYTACAKVSINGPLMHEADSFITSVMHRAWPQTDDQVQMDRKGPLNAFLRRTASMVGIAGQVLERLQNEHSRFDFMR